MLILRIAEREGKAGQKYLVGEHRDGSLLDEKFPAEIVQKIKNEYYYFFDYVLAPWAKTKIPAEIGGFYKCRIEKTKEAIWHGKKGPRPILVIFFIPVEPAKETIRLDGEKDSRNYNKIEIENGEFVFYRAFKETDGVRESEIKYERMETVFDIEAYVYLAKYRGVYFRASHVRGLQSGYGSGRSKSFPPPFNGLPDKYKKMAEAAWRGEVLRPGVWVKDKNASMADVTAKVSVTGDGWTSFGDLRDPVAIVENNLVIASEISVG